MNPWRQADIHDGEPLGVLLNSLKVLYVFVGARGVDVFPHYVTGRYNYVVFKVTSIFPIQARAAGKGYLCNARYTGRGEACAF